MASDPIRVFLVDDDEDDYLLTRDLLAEVEGTKYRLDWTPTSAAGLQAMQRAEHDVYLIDYRLGAYDGLELLRDAIRHGCRAPIILLTGQGDRDVDVEAMKAGAADYLIKGSSATVLERSIRYAIEHKHTEEALRRLHEELELRVQQRTAELAEANRALHAEVAERTRAEERVTASLHEKEVLLREIHHRVKNNMQFISSLLKLQSQYLQDPRALAMFKESQDRVKSMAMIHEKLYRSSNLARIDFADYVHSLAAQLFRAYAIGPGAVTLDIHVVDVHLRVDSAIPAALLIHELVANALKHTFPQGRGTIRIDIRPVDGDRYVLVFTDNGVGGTQDLAPQQAESLGMQLIHGLVDQLEGSIEFASQQGTTFTIRFADVHYRARG